MHSLLQRQLRRHTGGLPVSPEWRAFIDAVDQAYRQADSDRRLLERSIELSSHELKQSNSRMRAVMQALPDLFLRLDAANVILDCRGASTAAGSMPELLIGKRLEHSPLAEMTDMLDEGRRRLETVRDGVSVERTLVLGGDERWFEARLVDLLDGEILILVRDITKRKVAEAALRRAHEELEHRVHERTIDLARANASLQAEMAERSRADDKRRALETQFLHAQKMEAIGRLAGGIAHDFNNLLTVIRGRGDLLLLRLPAEAPLRTDVGLIVKTAERAARLTQQLLAFSRKQVLEPKVFDLNGVVAGMTAMLQRLIGEDIELVTTLYPALGGVKADPSQIEQVILNLAVNARDAMPDGGRLTIETARVAAVDRQPAAVQHQVVLAVRDTGHGMDATTRARLFEPFFTTKEHGKGTGLGLATVYGIVQQSGGRIEVRSEPGAGASISC
jgi:C4-dicarboxylate-specific signal transduction histidine kinase